MKQDILTVILHRGTATYKNGKLDFTHGEGGTSHSCCRGIFRSVLKELDPGFWMNADNAHLYHFTQESFEKFMNAVISRLR